MGGFHTIKMLVIANFIQIKILMKLFVDVNKQILKGNTKEPVQPTK